MEIYWRDNFTCPTESEYKQMTIRKTGGLFMLAIRLMQLFSVNKNDFTKLTAILGLYFQIRDDYCNLNSKEYSENKSFCEDLTEGKFSFPIIHAVQMQTHDKQVLRKLKRKSGQCSQLTFNSCSDFRYIATKNQECSGKAILYQFTGKTGQLSIYKRGFGFAGSGS
jgi:geranylgeranyl pyrophosphate synthase